MTPPLKIAEQPSQEGVERKRLYAAASSALRFAGSRNAISAADEWAILALVAATPKLADPTSEAVERMRKAAREAKVLIDEINERATSRAFYGIDQPLHAKLCTVRATLARALATNAPEKVKG